VVLIKEGAPGGYARIFLTKNYREATDPVLQACGDHQ
jgi:hypothetical protein